MGRMARSAYPPARQTTRTARAVEPQLGAFPRTRRRRATPRSFVVALC